MAQTRTLHQLQNHGLPVAEHQPFSASRFIRCIPDEYDREELQDALSKGDDEAATVLKKLFGLAANVEVDLDEQQEQLGQIQVKINQALKEFNFSRGFAQGNTRGGKRQKNFFKYTGRPTVGELGSDPLKFRQGNSFTIRFNTCPSRLDGVQAVIKTRHGGGDPNDINATPESTTIAPVEIASRDLNRLAQVGSGMYNSSVGFNSDILLLLRKGVFRHTEDPEDLDDEPIVKTVNISKMLASVIKDWKLHVLDNGALQGDAQAAFVALTDADNDLPTVTIARNHAAKLTPFARAMICAIYEAAAQIHELQVDQLRNKPDRDKLVADRIKHIDVFAVCYHDALLQNTGSMLNVLNRMANAKNPLSELDDKLKIGAVQKWSDGNDYKDYASPIEISMSVSKDAATTSAQQSLADAECTYCKGRGHVLASCEYHKLNVPSGLAKAIQSQNAPDYFRVLSGYKIGDTNRVEAVNKKTGSVNYLPTLVSDGKNGFKLSGKLPAPKH
jgi:hypothetical protein